MWGQEGETNDDELQPTELKEEGAKYKNSELEESARS